MEYLMGIDNGGTYAKAAIFDKDGKQVSVASAKLQTLTPKPGYSERDLDLLWAVNTEVIRDCIKKSAINPNKIACVSFSGHGKGLYMIKADGTPAYNGILSQDTRAWEYIEKWHEDGTAKKVFQKTFQDILVMQHVTLLAWVRDHVPDVLRNTAHIFAVKDYIRYKLTGTACAEYSDFTGSNLINLTTKEYDAELLDLFGLCDIYDKLPPLKNAAEICGYVTKDASLKTLIPEGIPVAAGMFDVDACGIASSLYNEEHMCMIAGTWSINEYLSKEPVRDGSVALNSMFCIPGLFLAEESSPTSAGNLEWFVRNLISCEETDAAKVNRSVYKLLDHWVASIEPQDSNVIFLPFLYGSNENPLAKGTFVGLTAYHNKKHMARAVFEGIVFSHVRHVKKLLKNRNIPKSISLSGGAANSDVWVQIFADALQIPVDVIEEKELGAQGAAIAAGIAAGIYPDYTAAINQTVNITKTIQPRKDYKEIYERKFHVYCAVTNGLNDAWKYFSD